MELDQEKQNQEAAERCRALAQRIVRELAPRSVQVLENSGLLELEAALDSFVNSQVEQIASTKLSGKSKEEMLHLLRRQSRPAGHRRYLPPQERAPR